MDVHGTAAAGLRIGTPSGGVELNSLAIDVLCSDAVGRVVPPTERFPRTTASTSRPPNDEKRGMKRVNLASIDDEDGQQERATNHDEQITMRAPRPPSHDPRTTIDEPRSTTTTHDRRAPSHDDEPRPTMTSHAHAHAHDTNRRSSRHDVGVFRMKSSTPTALHSRWQRSPRNLPATYLAGTGTSRPPSAGSRQYGAPDGRGRESPWPSSETPAVRREPRRSR